MAVNEKDILEFEQMFNLPSVKDDNNEQAEEYGHSTESSGPFEELIKDMSTTINNTDIKGKSIIKETPHDIIKDVCLDSPEKMAVSLKEEVKDSDDIFDSLPTSENALPDNNNDTEKDSEEDVNNSPLEEPNDKTTSKDYGEICGGNDKIEWKLESPSPMYNSFYAKKRDVLFKYMVGGQVEYKRWMKELEEAKVIIKGEIFDPKLVVHQMEEVQQHRERVKAIHIKVNNQYFTLHRFIEILRGFLARIEYLKPVIRQEGLIMEHMRDIELYYTRLEALHDSAATAEKVLAAAFETLSRKCTICMELPPAERFEKPISSNSDIPPVREYSAELKEFDDLPINAEAVPKDYKVGPIRWDEI